MGSLSPAWADGTATEPLVWSPLYEPGAGGRMVAIAASPHESGRLLVSGDMLGMGLSLDGGESWVTTTGLRGYEMADITWHPEDPDTVWVGSMSGPYVSRDGGHTWAEARAGMGAIARHRYSSPIEKVLFDPNNTNRLIAVAGSSRMWGEGKPGSAAWGRVWESTDAGDSWRRLATMTPNGSSQDDDAPQDLNISGAAFAAGSSGRLFAAVWKHGLYVSEDGGRTWQPRNTGLPHLKVRRVIAHPTDADHAYVALSSHKDEPGVACLPGGIFETRDAGLTWSPINNGLTQVTDENASKTSRYRAVALADSAPQRMVAFDASWQTGIAFVSDNAGGSWTPVATRSQQLAEKIDGLEVVTLPNTAYPSGLGMEAAAFDPNDPNVIYACGSEFILRSDDFGQTWRDICSFLVQSNTPYGPTFRGRGYSGLVAKNIQFHPKRPGVSLFQAMDAGRVWISTDDMHSWSYHGVKGSPWSGGQDAVFAEGDRVYAVFGQRRFSGVGRSLDGGRTWDIFQGKAHGLPGRDAGSPDAIVAHPHDGRQVWTAIDGKLYASKDAAENWMLLYDDHVVRDIVHDPSKPSALILATAGGVVYADGSGGFSKPLGPKSPRRAQFTASPDGTVYLCVGLAGDEGVWRRTSREKQWTLINDGPYPGGLAVDPHNPNRLALATSDQPYHDRVVSRGVLLSDDAGRTWHPANDQLGMLRVSRLAFDPHTPGRLVAGTGGRGFWQTTWPADHRLGDTPWIRAAQIIERFDGDTSQVVLNTNTQAAGWVVTDGAAKLEQAESFGSFASAALTHAVPSDRVGIVARFQLSQMNYSNGHLGVVALSDNEELGGSHQPDGIRAFIRTGYDPGEYIFELRNGGTLIAEQPLPQRPSSSGVVTLTLVGQRDAGSNWTWTARCEGIGDQPIEIRALGQPASVDSGRAWSGVYSRVGSKNSLKAVIDLVAIAIDPDGVFEPTFRSE
ncbi:MAG: hypothetical protein AAF593_03810 [Planctomycetota bacterium]